MGAQAPPFETAACPDLTPQAIGPTADGGLVRVLNTLEEIIGRTNASATTAYDAAQYGPSSGVGVFEQSLSEIERIYDAAVWKQLCIALPQQARGSLDTLLKQG
jgi:hypothetical protein